MTTFTDGVPPLVTPEPGDGTGPGGHGVAQGDKALDHAETSAEHCDNDDADDGMDTGSGWLREEIQRRIAAGHSGTGGRHARRESVDSSTSLGYVPRHSVATPGPGAPRPGPVGGPAGLRPTGLLRRERTGAEGPFEAIPPAAWSRPARPDTAGTAPPSVDADPPDTLPAPPPPDLRTDVPPEHPVAPAPVPPATIPPATTPPAAALRRAVPTAPVGMVPPIGSVAVPGLSGDPLFTARTPAPGSRERGSSLAVPEQRGVDEVHGGPESQDELESRRVRVVLAERKGVARPVRTVVDIQEGTGVGELLRSNLIGSQLAVALRFAVGAGLTLGVLPLLFAMFPELGRMEVLGLRLPWLLLGVLVYPFLFGLGLWHARTAERVEQNFADHVQD